MVKLTKKQRKMLDFVRDFIRKEGYSPSIQDINREFKFISQKSTGLYYMRQLVRKGWLERPVPHARTIRFKYTNKPLFPGYYILRREEGWEPVEVYQEGETLYVMRIRKFEPEVITEGMGLWRML